MKMKNLIKQFEKESGLRATIESDLYADGEIYTKEYTEWLEKRVQALSMSGVRVRSEQLACKRDNDFNSNRCIYCGSKAGNQCGLQAS